MTKEQLIALGLDEATATKIAAASTEELKGFIPKADHDTVVEAKGQLEKDIKVRDKQLEELKKVDAEGLQKKIEDLQTVNKTTKVEYETKIKDLQFTSAIKVALADKAHDVDLVAGLFDRSKLLLGDDGKITGLDEQLKTLQTGKAFLFKSAANPGYTPKGGDGSPGKNPFAKETFNLTEQGNLLKADPAQAKVLAAAAGVVIEGGI